MTFKDLHYSLGKFKTDVRSQLARKNPLQNQDTKALSMWIFEERNDLKAMRVSAYHRNETTKAFLDWIDEHDDPDLQDIGGKLAQLIEMHTEVEHEYVDIKNIDAL
ncbi:hypothetical protein BDA99DRAFT_69535 [Phascolomyces articulosus]|uniref:Uncharacterized protein n=1 Tax=Phascolomyces articulosus TaxID=60185 RepID=A0AAD5JZR9_9FUNG|nr:hypothetical protein BDA99DRAFT_69535 [Phascolomyces articulosus]